MRIAVCDYDAKAAEYLRNMIRQYCVLYELPVEEIRCVFDPKAMWGDEEYFEIVFIGFGGATGYSEARKLRQRDRGCRIVLVDDTNEYAIRSVRLHCADFVVKPVEFPRVVQSMRLATGGVKR